MKLATFTVDGAPPRAGVLLEGDAELLDVGQAHAFRSGEDGSDLSDVLKIIEGGERSLAAIRELISAARGDFAEARVSLARARLLAPVPRPTSMRDFLCFERHLKNGVKNLLKRRADELMRESGLSADAAHAAAEDEIEKSGYYVMFEAVRKYPVYYRANSLAVCGPDTDVIWPKYSKLMDFELEFGCYIGKRGHDIPRDQAGEHIFGYTIFNDFSARDEQTLAMRGNLGPGKGKDFDNSNSMGPYLVTADEIPDPYGLEMVARVNGAEWSRGNSREMGFKFEDLIANISRDETLYPGEFLGSGTVPTGCGIEMNRFLSDGDVVELEVEKIGTLRNRVRVSR